MKQESLPGFADTASVGAAVPIEKLVHLSPFFTLKVAVVCFIAKITVIHENNCILIALAEQLFTPRQTLSNPVNCYYYQEGVKMERDVIFLSVLLAITFILQVAYLAVSNNLAEDTYPASKLSDQLKKVQLENIQLREQILTSSSLTEIGRKAKERGFVPAEMIYIY